MWGFFGPTLLPPATHDIILQVYSYPELELSPLVKQLLELPGHECSASTVVLDHNCSRGVSFLLHDGQDVEEALVLAGYILPFLLLSGSPAKRADAI